ncbi:MAG: hypothetical protein ACP5MM_06230 [Acidithiobacillus sp.]
MRAGSPATRWNISPKTLQRWRSEGRGPRFMKMSKRVVYPIDEILDYESQALRASTWESASDVVLPNASKYMDPREISFVTGLPLYIFTQKQTRDALGIPYRRVQKLIRFDRDEAMAWAQRWLQNTKELGIDVTTAPGDQYRTLQHALASLPV